MPKGKTAPTEKEAKQDKPLIPEIPKKRRQAVASQQHKMIQKAKKRSK